METPPWRFNGIFVADPTDSTVRWCVGAAQVLVLGVPRSYLAPKMFVSISCFLLFYIQSGESSVCVFFFFFLFGNTVWCVYHDDRTFFFFSLKFGATARRSRVGCSCRRVVKTYVACFLVVVGLFPRQILCKIFSDRKQAVVIGVCPIPCIFIGAAAI